MRLSFGLACVATLLGLASETNADVYRDPDTGFSFSQYNAPITTGTSYITFRVAIPSPATSGQPYDVVLQVVAPISAGWVGVAWGGSMTNNPLLIGWANGASSMTSIRRATSHTAPTAYTAGSLQLLKKGSKSNGTHWQFTAKCTGCTQFTTTGTTTKSLNPAGSNRLAFAYARTKPSQPSSESSPLNVHDLFNYWEHDFSSAGNAAFQDLVDRNL
ncbi:CBD9-like protein [Annulohypoxylon maeteangense]|uniref:CBD9-like protein n=1 Tax=Annulohypoxylon maeteangense TaxID=1927788 RepID=UPI002007A153|nr:CBD9-like protein [Annulohypoxylon maeteangense]KAI0880854.1 CBD9-like protein [Annulohypoxylon maeteangense]